MKRQQSTSSIYASGNTDWRRGDNIGLAGSGRKAIVGVGGGYCGWSLGRGRNLINYTCDIVLYQQFYSRDLDLGPANVM